MKVSKNNKLSIKHYNKIKYDNLNKSTYDDIQPGIFNYENQQRIDRVCKEISDLVKNKKIALDAGIGSGNTYFHLNNYFSKVYGIDLSLKLAKENGIDDKLLFKGDIENLPFNNNNFDCISAYGVVHHLADPIIFFEEAYRCLNSGGVLYIDNDKNKISFKVFINIKYFFMLIFRGTRNNYLKNYFHMEEQGEYHNGGFYKNYIMKRLKLAGFSKIKFRYRMTNNPNHQKNFLYKIIKVIKLRFLFSHFYIIAQK
tara:strand:+ start:1516 stop:2280 length:765 start_codon:yes stop_codon:yes gene_type:complete